MQRCLSVLPEHEASVSTDDQLLSNVFMYIPHVPEYCFCCFINIQTFIQTHRNPTLPSVNMRKPISITWQQLYTVFPLILMSHWPFNHSKKKKRKGFSRPEWMDLSFLNVNYMFMGLKRWRKANYVHFDQRPLWLTPQRSANVFSWRQWQVQAHSCSTDAVLSAVSDRLRQRRATQPSLQANVFTEGILILQVTHGSGRRALVSSSAKLYSDSVEVGHQ